MNDTSLVQHKRLEKRVRELEAAGALFTGPSEDFFQRYDFSTNPQTVSPEGDATEAIWDMNAMLRDETNAATWNSAPWAEWYDDDGHESVRIHEAGLYQAHLNLGFQQGTPHAQYDFALHAWTWSEPDVPLGEYHQFGRCAAVKKWPESAYVTWSDHVQGLFYLPAESSIDLGNLYVYNSATPVKVFSPVFTIYKVA